MRQSPSHPFDLEPTQRDRTATHTQHRVLAAVLVVSFATGCSHAFVQPATRYAELGARSARTLEAVTSVVHRTCEESRRAEFLQQRLLRLKSESIGVALGPDYYVDGAHWSENAKSTGSGQTWREYCVAMDQSAEGFAIGLAALEAHADAIGALASPSQEYVPDFGALYGGAEALEHGILRQDSSWLKLVPPLTNPIKELSHLWLAEHNQASLKRMVQLAQPAVHRLVMALRQYLDAIAGQLVTLSTREATLVQSLEQNAGFASRAEPARGLRCHQASPAATPVETELAQLCEWTRLQQRQLDALSLLQIHENAQRMAATANSDSATLARFRPVLEALDSSSLELARLAASGDDGALARVSQDLQRLTYALQNIENDGGRPQ